MRACDSPAAHDLLTDAEAWATGVVGLALAAKQVGENLPRLFSERKKRSRAAEPQCFDRCGQSIRTLQRRLRPRADGMCRSTEL